MQLSVIIIGYNSWVFLEKNLASLAFLFNNPQTEIIYVDNASTDGTPDQIKRRYPNIFVIENRKNAGVSIARNQGIRKASGKYLWFLDSDTEVTETALATMLQFMDETSGAGLCGCKMYGQDGQVQESCRKFPSVCGKLKATIRIFSRKLNGNIKAAPQPAYDTASEKPFEVDYVIGACQLIRKEAQEKTGLLDEHIFYGPEDADFCLRMKQSGYAVYYLPQVSIYHAYQRIASHKIFSPITLKHLWGLIYYFWKYRRGVKSQRVIVQTATQ
ncbi:MAG: glycosyltransferase family 2 protein [Dysgonamonadaceae bacterium]|jgi:GT2 family glycosyltransferase|nr:glycosyltransferase family 2 protein [Dysgonamonadaceae bacterium]